MFSFQAGIDGIVTGLILMLELLKVLVVFGETIGLYNLSIRRPRSNWMLKLRVRIVILNIKYCKRRMPFGLNEKPAAVVVDETSCD